MAEVVRFPKVERLALAVLIRGGKETPKAQKRCRKRMMRARKTITEQLEGQEANAVRNVLIAVCRTCKGCGTAMTGVA